MVNKRMINIIYTPLCTVQQIYYTQRCANATNILYCIHNTFY